MKTRMMLCGALVGLMGCGEIHQVAGPRQSAGDDYPWVGQLQQLVVFEGPMGEMMEERLAGCTAAVVRHGLILTAKHCSWADLITLCGSQPEPWSADVALRDPIVDPDNDLAFYEYPAAATEGLFGVPAFESATGAPDETTELIHVGFPATEQQLVSTGCYATGVVRVIRKYKDHGPQYFTNCPGHFGHSGGPFVSRSGDDWTLYGAASYTPTPRKREKYDDEFGPITPLAFSAVYESTLSHNLLVERH